MTEIPTTVKNPELVEKRREQIVIAAIKLFSQKGFHKTTLKDLAEEAGLSQGNIYGYIGSKEDIFFLIHNFLADFIGGELNRIVEDVRNPVEKLRRIVRAEFNFMAKWADAILLIYQEGHILSGPLLRKLLEKERAHLAKIEEVIQDCVIQGSCGHCNARLTANLIKSMVDSWILKRWDLRGHATQLEAERAILDGLFDGLLNVNKTASAYSSDVKDLEGKTALVVNAGTPIGSAIASFILSRGGRVAACTRHRHSQQSIRLNPVAESERFQSYILDNGDDTDVNLLNKIEADFGPIDIYVHDLGIGHMTLAITEKERIAAGIQLETNLKLAQDAAIDFQQKASKNALRRVIYIAPWAWDKYADPVRYETVKAAVVALSKTVAKTMALWRTNVNCIVPGFIATIRQEDIQEELVREVMNVIPAGHLGELSDITAAVLFLAGDASKYLTGQVLKCAGGAE